MSYLTITSVYFPKIINSIGQTIIEYGNNTNQKTTYVTFVQHPYVQKRNVIFEKGNKHNLSLGYFNSNDSYTVIKGGYSSTASPCYTTTKSYFTFNNSSYNKLSEYAF